MELPDKTRQKPTKVSTSPEDLRLLGLSHQICKVGRRSAKMIGGGTTKSLYCSFPEFGMLCFSVVYFTYSRRTSNHKLNSEKKRHLELLISFSDNLFQHLVSVCDETIANNRLLIF